MTTSVGESSIPGSPYTWATADFCWTDEPATNSWANANSGYAYTLTVTETETTAELWAQIFSQATFLEGWASAELRSQIFSRAPFTEGWASAESLKNNTNKTIIEGWTSADLLEKALLHFVLEGWASADIWIDYCQFVVRMFEGFTTAEAIVKNSAIVRAEAWSSAEATSRQPALLKLEGWTSAEFLAKIYGLSKSEVWSSAEAASRQPTKSSSEAFWAAESQTKGAVKVNLEGFTTYEMWADYAQFMLRLFESWLTTETPQKHPILAPFPESFHTLDSESNSTIKAVLEGFFTNETFSRAASFNPLFEEVWSTVDGIAKSINITKVEAWQLMTTLIRNANAVLSDISISTGALTFQEFLALNSPAGFEPFSEFSAGDYQYQKALIQIILQAQVTADKPELDVWQLNIDVPDVTDKGSVTLAAAVTPVRFARFFNYAPQITLTIYSAIAGATVNIVGSITSTGFSIELLNASGAMIAGTVGWVANGY